MPPDLREQIEREAVINGRSINAEILSRLWASLGEENVVLPAAPMHQVMELGYSETNDNERAMLSIFRRWPPEKQLSFLVLFR